MNIARMTEWLRELERMSPEGAATEIFVRVDGNLHEIDVLTHSIEYEDEVSEDGFPIGVIELEEI